MGIREIVIYTAPTGRRIKAVHGRKDFRGLIDNYVDKSHSAERVSTALGMAQVYGDRKGDDVGVYTRANFTNIRHFVRVELDPLRRAP